MIALFLTGAADSDVAVAMVERAVLLARYPESQRTWLKFRGGRGENHPHPTLPLKGRASSGGLRATGSESAEAIGECLDRLAGPGDGGVEALQVAARVRDHVSEHRGAGTVAGELHVWSTRAAKEHAGEAGGEAPERGR